MPRRDQQPELGERPAPKLRRAPDTGLGIGERFVGAFIGGLFGLPLGFLLSGIHFFAYQQAFRYDLVGATVLYCAAYTFIFGETLGDVMMGVFRIFQIFRIAKGIERGHQYRDEPDATWLGSILTLVLFTGPLLVVLYLVAQHHPG